MGRAAVNLLLSWRLKSIRVNAPDQQLLAFVRFQYIEKRAKIRLHSNTARLFFS
jgi:hypothetical protein